MNSELLTNHSNQNLGDQKMSAKSALCTLFESCATKNLWLQVVYTHKDGTRGYSFTDLPEAIERVEECCSNGREVSVRARIFNRTPDAWRWGGRIGFVWADIRYNVESHNFLQFPKTQEKAMEMLRLFELPPSLVLHTSGLIQACWLLQRPIVIKSVSERMRAKMLLAKLQDSLSVEFAENGWESANTCDLAHQLILAKGGSESQGSVEIASVLESRPEARYSASQIQTACNRVIARHNAYCARKQRNKAGEKR